MRYPYEADNRRKEKLERRDRKRERIQEELSRYGSEILNSEEMRHAFTQKHHTLSTVGEHSLRVAKTSLEICHVLQKMHISTDIPAVVAGSLCHDLGILGRDAVVEDLHLPPLLGGADLRHGRSPRGRGQPCLRGLCGRQRS